MSPASANAKQIAYWNEQAGPRWVCLRDRLDIQLHPLGQAAIGAAGLGPGQSALDVGCGCGASSRQAAARVGPAGRVLGVDLSRPMLDRARSAASGIEQLSFLQADAQTHEFEAGGFDAIVSRFGVMFFDSPDAAFANLRRALAPGGRLAFVCWQALACNPWMSAPLVEVAKHVRPLPPPPAPGEPGPFSFADADRVRGILEASGFEAARVDPLEGTMPPGGARTVEEAAEFVIEIGPAGQALREAGDDPARRSRVARAVAKAFEPWVDAEGAAVPYAAWLVTARAPRASSA